MLLSKISLLLFLFVGDVVLGYRQTRGVFTGINSATGERPARREIKEMKNDVPTFSLYIQALAAMMDTAETDQISYFQINGIHGRPYYAWDNVKQTNGAPQTGYCTHDDALFMTWHRPYLAFYEQVMAGHVQRIAKGYNSATYQRAADRFRIPYWDWAAAPYGMPSWFSDATIRIQKSSGMATVTNPLKEYVFRRFPYISSTFPSNIQLSHYSRTVRRPSSAGAASNPAAVNSLLNSQGRGIAQQLYTVFSRATAWNNMATQASSGPSFEGPHGWLHITVGGDGHMTDVGYAAFDPIFMLHHANVDRLGAMWQAIYPDSFLSTSKENGGTYTLVPGQTLNINTPLLPFHRADGNTAWTSSSARFPKTFGYSYPDVKDWAFGGSASRLRANVTARVNQLYNSNGRSAKRSINGDTLEARNTTVDREWTVGISAPNSALNGVSYTVQLFLGDVPTDPAAWVNKAIGAMYVLAMPMTPASGPVTAHTEVVVTEFIQKAGVDPNDVTATRAFLDKNLNYGVQKPDGSVVPRTAFKGLTFQVEDDVVQLPVTEEELPTYSDKTVHPDITLNTPPSS